MKKQVIALLVVLATLWLAGCSSPGVNDETPAADVQPTDALTVEPTEAPTTKSLNWQDIFGQRNEFVSINGNDVLVRSGIYQFKDWETDLGTYDKAAIPNETVAVNVAQQIFDGMRKSEEMEKHVPLSVFFDTKDEIWIVTFNEPFDEATGTIRVGGGYSFAIQKSDGKVLRIWMNE